MLEWICHNKFPETVRDSCQRQENLHIQWDSILRPLVLSYYETKAPATTTCFLCGASDENIIWCRDCGPMAYMCHECATRIHDVSILHDPYEWQVCRMN